MEEKKRLIPDIMMDIMKDYALVDGGKKPLLDYLDEIMGAYAEIEKTFDNFTIWQNEINKEIREMKIEFKRIKKE